MQTIINDVLAMRRAAREALPGSMLRWDARAKALLVSDAPRRGACESAAADIARAGFACRTENGLMWIDMPVAWYQALRVYSFDNTTGWKAGWEREQSILSSMYRREHSGAVALCTDAARQAILAGARGEIQLRTYIASLPQYDAACLRKGNGGAASVCANIAFAWLKHMDGIGAVPFVSVDFA